MKHKKAFYTKPVPGHAESRIVSASYRLGVCTVCNRSSCFNTNLEIIEGRREDLMVNITCRISWMHLGILEYVIAVRGTTLLVYSHTFYWSDAIVKLASIYWVRQVWLLVHKHAVLCPPSGPGLSTITTPQPARLVTTLCVPCEVHNWLDSLFCCKIMVKFVG